VVHISQLKLAVKFKGPASTTLPFDGVQFQVPLQVVVSRMVSHSGSQIAQVLVKWSELLGELATWEDPEALKQQFLGAPALGQAVFQKQRNVSTEPATEVAMAGKEDSPRCCSQPRKVNTTVANPKWVMSLQ
jgi:hypothetical protein